MEVVLIDIEILLKWLLPHFLTGNIYWCVWYNRCLLFGNRVAKPSASLISSVVIGKDLMYTLSLKCRKLLGHWGQNSVFRRIRHYCTAEAFPGTRSALCSAASGSTKQAVWSLSSLPGVCLFAGRPDVGGPCSFSLLGFVHVLQSLLHLLLNPHSLGKW